MNPHDRFIRICGWIVLVGSLVGAACAVLIIAWPQEVSPSRYSYPFSPTSYVVVQVFFALRDTSQVVGLVGLCLLTWRSSGRMTRAGLAGSLLGMVTFVAAELFAISAANSPTTSHQADLVNAAYAPPMIVFGLAAIVAGVGLSRSRLLPGALGRWIVLAVGVYVFVPLFPAVFAPMVVGRIAIGGWLLLYAGIGVAMLRAVTAPVAERVPVTRVTA